MNSVTVNRLHILLTPSQYRVLIRPFIPYDENRVSRIIARVLSLTDEQTHLLLEQVLAEFTTRHTDIRKVLTDTFARVRKWTLTDQPLSEERKLLIGAYFTQEYSLESAALFNPSIVLHPDQSNLAPGAVRFIMSLRATGEGHISSIVFREGTIDERLTVTLVPPSPYVTEPERILNASYDKKLFTRKLSELGIDNEFSREVLGTLPNAFTIQQLCQTIDTIKSRYGFSNLNKTAADGMLSLANSNYEVQFRPGQSTSQRVIFPSSTGKGTSMEDARFVLFKDETGTSTYYATFTSYDGKTIIPELMETSDFLRFRFITLNGPAVRNKGMALFPRKINGLYAMLSRQDNENLFLMYSDNIHFWYSPEIIVKPTYPWEFVQLGNSGSPIELDAGWLVLSHGVGPIRKYCIGAFLLDKKDPSRLLGRLPQPLLSPNENERSGYVPNVVYTCGALALHGHLIMPYAMSDYAASFATINIQELLDALV